MTKEQFDKKYVGEELVVNCRTKELAKECLKLAHRFKYKWRTNESYVETSYWNGYRENNCYSFCNGTYRDKSYFVNKGYKIVEFKGETMEMKASENWILKAFKEEFGLVEGDKFKITDTNYSPYTISENEITDKDNNSFRIHPRLFINILSGVQEIEKIKDTVTVVLAETGEEVEISKESAEALFNR